MALSKRDEIRQRAEALLRGRPDAMHYTDIAAVVLQDMGLGGQEPPKALNTALHDDPQGRFTRVGPGRWALRSRAASAGR